MIAGDEKYVKAKLCNVLVLGFGAVKLDLKSKTKKGVVRLLFMTRAQFKPRFNTKGSMLHQSLSTDCRFC